MDHAIPRHQIRFDHACIVHAQTGATIDDDIAASLHHAADALADQPRCRNFAGGYMIAEDKP